MAPALPGVLQLWGGEVGQRLPRLLAAEEAEFGPNPLPTLGAGASGPCTGSLVPMSYEQVSHIGHLKK